MAELPPNFRFSQRSLQDFVDCPRRFWLRYVARVLWPAEVVEEALAYERRMQQGALFHRLAQQHILGIDPARLTAMVSAQQDPDLSRWWANYLEHPPPALRGAPALYPEADLAAPLGGCRLMAQYDLLAITPGERAVIIDWKTGPRPAQDSWLARRMQTRVYRYVLAGDAARHLNQGGGFAPEQISMVYWFAESPDRPARFPYDAGDFAEDAAYLGDLVAQILQMDEDAFVLTEDVRRCRFCTYRSLCDRGEQAGSLDALDPDFEPEAAESESDMGFDFDQIQEIAF